VLNPDLAQLRTARILCRAKSESADPGTLVIAVDQVIDSHAGSTLRRAWPLAGMLVLIVGLIGLLSDSLKLQQPRILNVHLLFGVLLLAVVARSLFNAAHALRGASWDQFHRYTRGLARQVYILLYVLAAVRLCLYVIEGAESENGALAFCCFSRSGSLDYIQIYIAYGIAAICLIRGSALFTAPRTH
jgi:hypothetical protein